MAFELIGDIVIGIDPGTELTGYGIIRENDGILSLMEAGVIRSGGQELSEKLYIIYKELITIIKEFKPNRMAVEELYAHYNHPKTSIIMGHARGVILLAGANSGLRVRSYPSTEIKKVITGRGRASKEKVQAMVIRILGLESPPKYYDITDALAAALTDIRYHRKFDLELTSVKDFRVRR